MAVNDLVLQVQLPGDGPPAKRSQGPPGQTALKRRDKEPQPVDGECERHGRPFNSAFERFELHEFHDQRPSLTRGESPAAGDNSRKFRVENTLLLSTEIID